MLVSNPNGERLYPSISGMSARPEASQHLLSDFSSTRYLEPSLSRKIQNNGMFKGIAADLVQIFLVGEFYHSLLSIRITTDFSSGDNAVSGVQVFCIIEGARKKGDFGTHL